jgi:hypothetical protein
LIPDSDLNNLGAKYVPMSVMAGIDLITDREGDPTGIFLGISLLLGVAANVTIFFRTPTWVSWGVPFIPWAVFAGFALRSDVPAYGIFFMFPFFIAWALGLALIHFARIRCKELPLWPWQLIRPARM